jgi:myo-inositol-1(or 4)-monophosphatase
VTDLRQTAEAAARAGGDVLRQHAGHVTGLRTKSGTTDMVSAADIASGVAVVSRIAGALPDARFVVEEPEVYELAGVTPGTLGDDEVWVIDPLDGTTSFVHSYPCWSVSVACLRHGRPVAAAVYNVPADEMVSAAAGEGAMLGGTRLTCTGASTLDRALLCTGFPYDRGEPFSRQMRLLESLVRPAHDVRRDGSAAVDLCSVAIGRVDGFWETSLQPWDMAAGVLIVEESGGLITDFGGNPWTVVTHDVVAANLTLHAVLLDAIRKADRR